MVRDAYYYALPLLGAAALVGWLTAPFWALPAVLLAAFFLWFFRDPERAIPGEPHLLVSPADGKVTNICRTTFEGVSYLHISIFLNVFDVHVNRSPISWSHPPRQLPERQVPQRDEPGLRRSE